MAFVEKLQHPGACAEPSKAETIDLIQRSVLFKLPCKP